MSVRNDLKKLPEDLWQDEEIIIKPIKTQKELIIALFDLQLREDQKDLVNPPSFSIGRAYLSPEDNLPCLIWNEGGEPIGFINFSRWLGQEAETHYSWSYFIDGEQQGKGYGKRAARMAVRLLQAADPEIPIKLSTEEANQKAQELYLSLGFRQLPERDGDDLVFGLWKEKGYY